MAGEHFSEEVMSLAGDMRTLMQVTTSLGWDRDEGVAANTVDLGAKPIGFREWRDGLTIARKLMLANPKAGRPTPGADPAGFIWLAWTWGELREFALQIHAGKFVWTLKDDMGKRTYEKTFYKPFPRTVEDALTEVSEALRAVMPAVH